MARMGDKIKERRKILGLTAEELGEKIGKNRATIYRYENGDIQSIPVKKIKPLADALGLDASQLIGQDVEACKVKDTLCDIVDEMNEDERNKLIEYAEFIISRSNLVICQEIF